MQKRLKIVFMGTPEFSIPSLKKLTDSDHTVSAVVTAPDKERGRGKKVSFTPVKEFALNNNITVLQPEKLKDQNFVDALKNIDADLFVVVAFRILPAEVFTLPKFGAFNLHGSLLPKYRGAAPIQWALINGETETGLTTFFIKEKVDTGNIIFKEKIMIDNEDNFGTLHDKMSAAGAELVLKTVNAVAEGNYTLSEQDNTLATLAPKITNEICSIDFSKPAVEIHNLVRGLSPFPCAYFMYDDKKVKIYKTKIVNEEISPGKIKEKKKELFIGCGKNSLQIIELQLEGRKRLTTEEFLRGFSFV